LTPEPKSSVDFEDTEKEMIFETTGWEKTTIQELVNREIIQKPMDGNHGGDHPTKEDYADEGIPFIMAKNIKDGKIDRSECKRLPKDFADNLRKGFAKEGDVLLSHKGTVGRTAIVEQTQDDYIMLSPQTTYYRVVDYEKLNNYYLKYYFDSYVFQETLKNWAGGGSTRPYLGITDQRNLPVVVPPRDVQDKIVAYLKPIDQKIRVNNHISETLDEMAQALFKSLFTDFDSHNAGLEYDSYFETKIPADWDKKSLQDIAEFLNGKAWQKFESQSKQNDLPVIKIKELRNGVSEDSDLVLKSDCPEKYILEDGQVIFSWSASLVLDIWTGGPAFLNQHLFKVSSEEYPRWFYYQWINYHIQRFRSIAEAKKTTMGHIKRSDLKEARVLVPPEDELKHISGKFEPVFRIMVEKRIENRRLEELRDTLLPKLMSGEIRVDNIRLDDLEVSSEV